MIVETPTKNDLVAQDGIGGKFCSSDYEVDLVLNQDRATTINNRSIRKKGGHWFERTAQDPEKFDYFSIGGLKGFELEGKSLSQKLEISTPPSTQSPNQQIGVAEWKNRTTDSGARTMDHLGKFDGKADEGFFVGYSVVSKAIRVFNKRTRIVEETLNIRFLENTPNVVGNGPDWLFDVDSLTISMNYVLVVARKQTNGIVGTRDYIVTGQAEKKTEPEQEFILIPFCTTNLLISQGPKDSEEDSGMKLRSG
ncbi:ribonuclease H-like domain-containing protein [Tanacetum coccineum]